MDTQTATQYEGKAPTLTTADADGIIAGITDAPATADTLTACRALRARIHKGMQATGSEGAGPTYPQGVTYYRAAISIDPSDGRNTVSRNDAERIFAACTAKIGD